MDTKEYFAFGVGSFQILAPMGLTHRGELVEYTAIGVGCPQVLIATASHQKIQDTMKVQVSMEYDMP